MRRTPWTAYVIFGVGVLTAYAIALLTSAPDVVTSVLSLVAMVGGIVAMLYGIRRHRPASRWPWLLVTSQLLVLAAPLLPQSVLEDGPNRAPSLADAVLLTASGIGAFALVRIVRRRTPGWDVPGFIDAGIISVAATLLSWIYVIDPLVGGTTGLSVRAVSTAYPLSDLLLAALGARLLLDGGPKPVAVRALTGYLVLIIAPDTISTIAAVSGDERWMPFAYLLWTAAALLIGLVGIHPSLRDVDAPAAHTTPDLGMPRLAALAFASLLAPAALLVQYLRGAPMHVPLICVGCGVLFLLVIARLAGLVAVQRRMAITDELTGLRTRRHFQAALDGAGATTAVLLLDIDHFKKVNDTYGHDGGDRVLREVARRLTAAVGTHGVLARYGGEEFAVLLTGANPEQARTVAGRIHAIIRGTPVQAGPETAIAVTVSVGVACSPADGIEPQQLPLLADQRLYQAKAAGRDRVSYAAGPETAAEPAAAEPETAAGPAAAAA
ncbi:GGDEF domain-containing protein [Actinoplanes subglobosus]|uniref:Diguanylate cyclase n=1 Tax=Actinoplanes subglobosus TaxID=1547892 RepID=A0ABV8IRW8_9ACTN